VYRQNTYGGLKANMVTVSGTTATIGTAVNTGVFTGTATADLLGQYVFIDSTRSRYVVASYGAGAAEFTLSGANLTFSSNVTLPFKCMADIIFI
jgi:hypothetical protein